MQQQCDRITAQCDIVTTLALYVTNKQKMTDKI